MFACNVQETVYQLMDDFELSLQKTDDLLFEVKACGAVQLLLMQNNTNFQTQMYEITIIGNLVKFLYPFHAWAELVVGPVLRPVKIWLD